MPAKTTTETTKPSGSDAPTCSESSIEDAVVNLIRNRGKVGRGKYRETMDRKDLRPEAWMVHLQEELADGLQYAERIKNCGRLLDDARSIMLILRHDREFWTIAEDWIKRHDEQFFPQNDQGEAQTPAKKL